MVISENDYLFVYGTLMRQYRKNPYSKIIQRYTSYVSTAFTTGEIYLVDFYPALVVNDSFDFVYGEKYKIHNSDELFNYLDEYEDFDSSNVTNSLFVREKIVVYEDVNVPPTAAWAYLFNRPTTLLRKIESGNFMDYVAEIEQK